MVNVDFITVVRIRFQYQMCIGTFVVSRNLSARQDGALHPQPKIRPPDRHARLCLRARALNRLFSDIRRRWLRTRLEIIHPDAVEGIQVSDSYLKKFGSGRALPPFPPFGNPAIFSTVLGVMTYSGAAKTGGERESLTRSRCPFSTTRTAALRRWVQ